MATALSVYVGKAVSGESYYSGSVISRQAFTVTVEAIDGGRLDTNYNGWVTIYANSPTNDRAFTIGSVYLSNGRGSTSATISSVYDQNSGRKITVADSAGRSASISVGVWFQGRATVFNAGSASYCQGTGHGAPPANYVALPGYGLCKKSVVLFNPGNKKTSVGQIWDVGPYFDADRCGSDYYWNTGDVPRAQKPDYYDKKRCEKCGTDCNKDPLVMKGAIIDISPNMMSQLGASGEVQNACWRFT
ncbi:hypothetical protein [Paenibacillus sp. 32O-W]|uniref:hypothetical protein n=1 Tax=Paenibacillus sp. 32O-W TaxID=1695218 RepID=UPI0011A2CC00|nr:MULTISPECIES: hypothetical protein [Paenibacillaceae]